MLVPSSRAEARGEVSAKVEALERVETSARDAAKRSEARLNEMRLQAIRGSLGGRVRVGGKMRVAD